MTLNSVTSLILHFSPHLIALLANYITVVEDIMSVNIVSQFQSSTFGHNLPTLQRGLSAIAELLVLRPYTQVCISNQQFSYPHFQQSNRTTVNFMLLSKTLKL